MTRLTYRRANRLSQLHDELLAAFPDLAGVLRVEGRDDTIWIAVPDAIDPAAIEAVVAAHTPGPPSGPPPPTAADLTALSQIAQSSGDLTPAQLSQGTRAVIAVLRYRLPDFIN